MSAFRSSHDDKHDDIIITSLLLLAACDLANKTPYFNDSLTVDEVRRRSGKIRRKALQHQFSNFQVHSWLCSLITFYGFNHHASFKLLHHLFKPCFDSFTPCHRKYTDFIVRSSTKKGSAHQIPQFHQLSGAWDSMAQDSWFLYDSSNNFRFNSWFLECLVEVFKANDCESAVDKWRCHCETAYSRRRHLVCNNDQSEKPNYKNCWRDGWTKNDSATSLCLAARHSHLCDLIGRWLKTESNNGITSLSRNCWPLATCSISSVPLEKLVEDFFCCWCYQHLFFLQLFGWLQ